MRASAEATRALVTATCSGTVCALRSADCACCSPARLAARRLSATLMSASASTTWACALIDRRALRLGRRGHRIVLLLRDFVFRQQSLQAFDVAGRLVRVGLRLALAGLWRGFSLALAASISFSVASAPLRA